MLSDEEFVRYQRQIALPEFAELGQQALSEAHVLIIGCGGLGSAASLYLSGAGVGKIVIVDDDVVDPSNLHRQVIYREQDVNRPKVIATQTQIRALNSNVAIRAINRRLDGRQLSLEVMLADVVLDCSDNMTTRQMTNQACIEQRKPLITAAAIGWKGQFSVFDYRNSDSENGCYRCLFPFDELTHPVRCSDSGVLGPVVGTMGNYQAIAAIQLLATGKFHFQPATLHLFDGLKLAWQTLSINRDSQCSACGSLSQSKVPEVQI